jgi:hypothetical protein
MANIPIWQGSSSFFPGDTPFGFYDYDYQFQVDADKVSKFCAQRLGWPIENVELQPVNFYTAFEQAVTVYGNELYAYRLRDNYLNLEGSNTSSALNQAIITPSMANIIRISEQYGEEAGTGGNTNWYSGSVILTASIQDYDLDVWAQEHGISGSNLEIKRVFYQGRPASADYYYGGGIGLGAGWGGLMGGIGGVAGYGYGSNWFVTPLSYNVGAIQEVELANDILLSAHSFELINNKLRIFPVPTEGDTGIKFWFQYLLKNERLNNSITQSPGQVSNVANANYNNPVYSQINSIGRMWIFEYTLALSKEMLGYVRGKYSTIPIPGAEVTLNQGDLIASATTDKESLIQRLRDYFDQTSRQALLERRASESEYAKQELNNVPMTIYIG